MNLPELAHSRLYAPLLAALELGRPPDAPAQAQPPAEPEPMHDDFEETRPIWFVSGIEEDSAVDGDTPA
jgi:hypothetical protein